MGNITAAVTVIIPYYNSSKTFRRALYSVCNQTYRPKFIKIVNDASTKAEVKKLNNICKQAKKYCNNRLKLDIIHAQKNSGPGSARNIGWNLTKTKYIAFLDSDDSWHARKIELQLKFMQKNKNIDICGHRSTVNFSSTSGSWSKNFNHIKYTKIPWYFLIFHNFFTTPTAMIKTKIKVRFLDRKYYTEDYLLWLICSLRNLKIYQLKITLTYLHKPSLGHSGLSGNIRRMSKGERETFKHLLDNKYINYYTYFICRVVIFVKEMRRYLFYQKS
jgi:glycosyltransferase involved in cell wall biosynthesis